METIPFYLVVILVCLFLSGAFFSSVETALVAMSRHRLKEIARKDHRREGAIKLWLDNPNKLLTTMLIGINFVAISAEWVMTKIVHSVVSAHDLRPPGWVEPTISIMTVAVVFITFGEIIPKILAVHNPERYSMAAIRPLVLVDRLITPFTWIMMTASNRIIRLFGGKPAREGPFVTEAEILGMVTTGEEEGVIEKDEREMIHSIFEFGDTYVKEVMVPRPDMACAPREITIGKMASFVENVGHSRVPIYSGTLENIVGIVNSKDLIRALIEGRADESVDAVMREPYFVPETKKIDDLLRKFQKRRVHMAIVVDEHGVTSGLVTLEDLLEEIVGEIRDEYDTEEPLYRWIDENTLHVNARIPVSELNDVLESRLPESEDFDTLGGFIFTTLGKVPKPGESVVFKDMTFTVESMNKRRINRVIVRKNPQRTGSAPGAGTDAPRKPQWHSHVKNAPPETRGSAR
ncbi:MAG: hemolysin family protein [bacterium]